MDLTDKLWVLIEPLFETKRRADGRGRPWRDPRDMLNGVLWVLRTGAPWKDLPSEGGVNGCRADSDAGSPSRSRR